MDAKVESWKLVLQMEDGTEKDFNEEIPQSVTSTLDELIEEQYPVTWREA